MTENFSQTRKYKNQKNKKYTFRNMVFCIQGKIEQFSLSFPRYHFAKFFVAYSRDVKNIYIHCLLSLQHYT